jgi:hypothetical protein
VVKTSRRGAWLLAASALAIAVAVPFVVDSLSSAPAPQPAPLTSAPDHSNPEAIASASRRAEELAAIAAAAQAAAQAELDAVAARLPSLVLSSPAEWDQWLPEGKPITDTTEEEDMRTCPRIADRLGDALGQRFSWFTGTLPQAPAGCTWVPVPLSYGPEAAEYPYVLTIGFFGDGSIEEVTRTGFYDGVPGPDPHPCPRLAVPGGGLLLRCGPMFASDDNTWTVLVPAARGAGTWVIGASGRTDAVHPSSEAFQAIVEATVGVYG